MNTSFDPNGDPARTLALLWRTGDKPGRSGLTVDRIITTAIDIADTEGLGALSMRRVASQLQSGAMSLYTHISGKSDLIELMVDTVQGELYPGHATPAEQSGDWRVALTYIARQNWDLFRRHPWLLQLTGNRPVLGPNVIRKYDLELTPLDHLGLSDVEIDSSLALVLTHVEAAARVLANATRLRRDSGLSDLEWWQRLEPVLDRFVDDTRFPVASRVGQASSEAYQSVADAGHLLDFGMARILDGIGLLIVARAEGLGIPASG